MVVSDIIEPAFEKNAPGKNNVLLKEMQDLT